MKKTIADENRRKKMVKKIKAIRLSKNLSRLDVAIEGGLNPNYYARLERGKTGSIQNKTYIGIKRGLGITWEELFGPDSASGAYLACIEKDYPEDES